MNEHDESNKVWSHKYQELNEGDVIQEGDEYQGLFDPMWNKVSITIGKLYNPNIDKHGRYHAPHRRPIAIVTEPRVTKEPVSPFDACANNELDQMVELSEEQGLYEQESWDKKGQEEGVQLMTDIESITVVKQDKPQEWVEGEFESKFWVAKVDNHGVHWNEDGPHNTYQQAYDSIPLLESINKVDVFAVTETRFRPLKPELSQEELEAKKRCAVVSHIMHHVIGYDRAMSESDIEYVVDHLFDNDMLKGDSDE